MQVIPHVTDEIKRFVLADPGDGVDFVLVEIGGTVGDIEGLPFFEAIRQLGQELPRGHACFVHLTLLPFIKTAGEMKTKPTQHSVKELRSIGIQPDVLLCRCEQPIPPEEKRKIGLFCNVRAVGGDPGDGRAEHLRRAARLPRPGARRRGAGRVRHPRRAGAGPVALAADLRAA